MAHGFTAPSVVVGVDGSRLGVRAARWALDEAIGRDLPLRLVAAAESAVNEAATAVRETGRQVTVETEVVAGNHTSALVEASRSAELVCVGGVGPAAAALAISAHCPLAVVRGAGNPDGWVVVELDESADSAAVLQYAVDEARMRSAPLRVLGTWQSGGSVQESTRLVHAQLDRRLEQWRHRYPDLDVLPVAVHGTGLSYLLDNSAAIQLVVVGVRNADVGELLGPSLHGTDFSILMVDRQRLL